MLRGLVKHERSSHEHAVLALWTCVDDGAEQIGRGGGRARRVEEKASVTMNELAVGETEWVAELPDFDCLEDAAVFELWMTCGEQWYLLERVLTLEQQLALLVVGFDAADVLALGGLEDGHQVVELLLELGADGGFEGGGRERREERGQEGGGRGGHEFVAIV